MSQLVLKECYVCVGDLDGYEEVADIKKIGFYHKSNKSHKKPHVDIFVDVLWKNGDETREPLQNLKYSWYLVTFFVSRNRESLDSLLCENLKNWAKKVRTNFPNWDIRSSENSDCVIFALSASLHNVTYLEAVSDIDGWLVRSFKTKKSTYDDLLRFIID